jgi:hypothetical protein
VSVSVETFSLSITTTSAKGAGAFLQVTSPDKERAVPKIVESAPEGAVAATRVAIFNGITDLRLISVAAPIP